MFIRKVTMSAKSSKAIQTGSLLVVFMSMILGCSFFNRGTPPVTAQPLNPSGSDQPHKPSEAYQTTDPSVPIQVNSGDEFKIVLSANPSTGYHWEITSNIDGGLLENISEDYVADEPVMPGSGGLSVWTFKALNAGETALKFGYFPPGSGDAFQDEKSFTILVK